MASNYSLLTWPQHVDDWLKGVHLLTSRADRSTRTGNTGVKGSGHVWPLFRSIIHPSKCRETPGTPDTPSCPNLSSWATKVQEKQHKQNHWQDIPTPYPGPAPRQTGEPTPGVRWRCCFPHHAWRLGAQLVETGYISFHLPIVSLIYH